MGLSDDSHGKHMVGLNYGRLAEYLKTSGVAQVYHLAEAEGGTGVGARKARPIVVGGDWWRDPFWDQPSR